MFILNKKSYFWRSVTTDNTLNKISDTINKHRENIFGKLAEYIHSDKIRGVTRHLNLAYLAEKKSGL